MRDLWRRTRGGPMSEADLLAVLRDRSGRSYQRELKRWVHSTAELPVRDLLEQHGVAILEEPAQLAQQLGLRVTENNALLIKTVLRGGAAEQAGFAPGDEWLGVEVGQGKSAQTWRLHRLEDLLLYAGTHQQIQALVARDKQIFSLPLTLPGKGTTWRLALKDRQKVTRWLAP